MASVAMKLEGGSDPSMSEDDDMTDIARRILVKCEEAKNDRNCGQMGGCSHCDGDTNHTQSCTFGVIDTHPPLKHLVSVTGCSLTFTIEIAGVTCMDRLLEPYTTISKEEALNWLRLLGYTQENLLLIHTENRETVNFSNATKCAFVSADPQTNRSGTIEVINPHQQVSRDLDELDHQNAELDDVEHNIQIKQEPLFGDEIICGYTIERNSSFECDKHLFINTTLEKECIENAKDAEVISQISTPTIEFGASGYGIPGEDDTMNSSPDAGSGMETLTDEEDGATVKNDDDLEESDPNITKTNREQRGSVETKHTSTVKLFSALEDTLRGDLESHSMLNHNNTCSVPIKCFKCKHCKYRTDSSASFALHNRKHNGGGKLTCDHCGYTTDKMCNFLRHTKNHTDFKPSKFKMHNISKNRVDTVRQGRTHGNETPLKSSDDSCGYRTSESSNMDVHDDTIHRAMSTVRQHKCTLCPYVASSHASVNRHLRTHIHKRPRPYKCTMCSYTASQSNNLSRHIKTKHPKERTQEYTVGQYPESDSSSQNKPKQTHSKSDDHLKMRLYKCTLCRYVGYESSSLKKHIVQKHTKERPHKCSLCPYSATQLAHLKTHMRIHSEHPYKCILCPYTSTQACNLKRHIMVEHASHSKI